MAVVACSSVEGSDADWSAKGQVLLGVGGQSGKQKVGTRLNDGQGKFVSEADPNSFGKSLGDEVLRVNEGLTCGLAACVDIMDEGDMTLNDVGSLEGVSKNHGLACEVSTSGKGGVRSGSVCLRTKKGDFILDGPVTVLGLGPIVLGEGDFEQDGSGNQQAVGLNPQLKDHMPQRDQESDSTIHRPKKANSKRQLGGLSRPAQNFANVQNAQNKKKVNKEGRRKRNRETPTESDSIQNSVGRLGIENQIPPPELLSQNHEGYELEVVLPAIESQEREVVPQTMENSTEEGCRGGSGLRQFMGASTHIRFDSPASNGGSGGRDLVEAHHIIDIQEDLGMNFNGAKEENVNRIVAFEERDRDEKMKWEQEHGYQ
ncbi:hypothetical protein P8452_28063 [Trifolium repens]|nr:hypothetical protein P8452_28063 [Trifolium repens]